MPEPFEFADALATGPLKGRGAALNPGNRYETVRLHVLGEFLDQQQIDGDQPKRAATIVYEDETRTIINHVDPRNSPDIPFEWSINPYRGCAHGCIYCYARPDHERLGFSCGLDFETRLVAKPNAPALLRKELASPKWKGDVIAMSGVTDCYQPIEAQMKITRGCLEVMAEFRQPVGIVTKNRLVLRDLDVLKEMAAHQVVHVAISVTTLDNALAAKLEPRASSPGDRLRTIRELTEAGVPTMAVVAPIIPGLTDKEIPAILEAVAEAGAISAGYVLLRLPHQIKALFLEWLQRHFPDRAAHVESLIRDTRDGELYQSAHYERKRGTGAIAEQIRAMFKLFCKRYGLDRSMPAYAKESFRRPGDGQMSLFGS